MRSPISPSWSFVLATIVSLPFSQATSAYAPVKATCPSGALVRAASGLSADESAYRTARKEVADEALKTWLAKTSSNFGVDGITLPTIGLSTSGGGYRSLLSGAGVIQGLDERDSSVSTSGLFQALTYQTGLSGGSWLLSSFIANDYPTITELKTDLWEEAFEDSLLIPDNLLVFVAYAEIVNDIAAKDAAGFPPTLTDPWGRLLAYQLLDGSDGGVATTLSSITTLSSFASHSIPFPIITALGVKQFNGECSPGPNATQYEFSPYEFGSWDSDLSAFTPTRYLGTTVKNGVVSGSCYEGYDNLGYILGTSSTLFNTLCIAVPEPVNSTTSIEEDLSALLDIVHDVSSEDVFATYPNPFYKYVSSTSVQNSANLITDQEELYLVDGGEALQNNPLWPMLQPARGIDVLIVNDNSADLSTNYPNGSEILTTYVQSLSHDLTLMPYIPSVETFIAEGLNTRATFFGCGDADKITIIYLPNKDYSYVSGVATLTLQYSKAATVGLIANGVEIADQGGAAGWGVCIGCAIMSKAGGTLDSACDACFDTYCYYE